MNKEFIPYEQALSMEKLGFVERCFGFYTLEGYYFPNTTPLNSLTYGCDAPLYQQAFRWFRETHKWNHSISTKRFPNVEYGYILGAMEGESAVWNINEFSTYEEAELACLKKLIEIAKQK